MPVKKKFEFLEHTADFYLAVYGESLRETFENAALAMFDVMTDVGKVEPKLEDDVKVEGYDVYALLYSWLEELLILFETKGNLYSRFKISNMTETPNGLKLRAKIWGEPYNANKHPQKVAVKAITYHQMEITRKQKIFTAKFILDI